MQTARLLLVDDDRDNLEVLAVILSEKYHVSSCRGATEALAALEGTRPDLLVLDIRMSPVDGLHCLKTIGARPGYERIPAIALTAFARDVERKTFLAAGFQAVVTKPVLDHRELLAVITSLLPSGTAPRYEPPASLPWRDRSHVSRALTVLARGGMIASYGFGPPSTPDAA